MRRGSRCWETSGGKVAEFFFPFTACSRCRKRLGTRWEGSGHAPSRWGARGRLSRMPSVPAEIKPGLRFHLLLDFFFFLPSQRQGSRNEGFYGCQAVAGLIPLPASGKILLCGFCFSRGPRGVRARCFWAAAPEKAVPTLAAAPGGGPRACMRRRGNVPRSGPWGAARGAKTTRGVGYTCC